MHAPLPFNLPVCSLEKETPQTKNTARLARCHLAKINNAILERLRRRSSFVCPPPPHPPFLPQRHSLLAIWLLIPLPSLLLLHPIITPAHGSHLEWYI